MQGIIVRSEKQDDFKAIDVVNLSAFEGEDEAKLVEELRARPGYDPSFSLVAEFNGRIVGHLMLTPATVRHAGGESKLLVLAPMSVVPSQSHRGIGTELLEAAKSLAGESGFGAIVVAGPPEYYGRLGFSPASKWDIKCNLSVPEDAVMVSELEAGALPNGGEVIYPEAVMRLYQSRT